MKPLHAKKNTGPNMFKATNLLKIVTVLSAMLFFTAQNLKAQSDDGMSDDDNGASPGSYTIALGVRAYPWAISARFNETHDAFEGFLALTPNWNRLTLLYELNKNLNVTGLRAYAGVGGHFIEWKQDWKIKHTFYGSDATIGIDGIIGIDYKFSGAPVDISVDWQPAVNLYGYKDSYILNGGINLRLAF